MVNFFRALFKKKKLTPLESLLAGKGIIVFGKLYYKYRIDISLRMVTLYPEGAFDKMSLVDLDAINDIGKVPDERN